MTETATWAMWAYVSGAWLDITSDTLHNTIRADWGISGNRPFERVASTGSISFTLKNTGSKYAPNLAGALAGWKFGVPIKFVVTYAGDDYVRFYGYITALDIEPGTQQGKTVGVQALDWINYAAQHPLAEFPVAINQTADQGVTTIVADMPIQPRRTSYDVGVNELPSTFDALGDRTKAISEISKLTLSELGYFYARKDREYGETLTFESAHHRHGWHALSPIPKTSAASGFLLKEDGGFLLKEDGGKIILNEVTDFSALNTMTGMSVEYGANLMNRIKITAYPKKLDTSPVILYALTQPVMIGPYATIKVKGNYNDPTGGASVNGRNMITPEVVTDYRAYTDEDALGTEITSNLTVTATYGTEGVSYVITNTTGTGGYITKLQARGYGVYTYATLETIVEDVPSANAYGYQEETVNQIYQSDIGVGVAAAKTALEHGKNPVTQLNNVQFIANSSSDLMLAFLALDVGDLVHITETQTGINGYYYIQSCAFEVMGAAGAGVYSYSWGVRQAYSLSSGLTAMAYEGRGWGNADRLNFGYLPSISNLVTWSAAFWVKRDAGTVAANVHLDTYAVKGTSYSGERVQTISYNGTGLMSVTYIHYFSAGEGYWDTPTAGVGTIGTWMHAVITHDRATTTNDPVIYINGITQAITESFAPIGVPADETGNPLTIGNSGLESASEIQSMDGLLKDIRIYNRIIGSAEALALYNGGTCDVALVTDGLVFQGPCVRTADLATYTDKTLTSTDRIIDNVYGAIGTASGAPIMRTI